MGAYKIYYKSKEIFQPIGKNFVKESALHYKNRKMIVLLVQVFHLAKRTNKKNSRDIYPYA